jgi:hypothetical protein
VPVDHEVLDRLREAATGASSWHHISRALAGSAEDAPDMRLRPFVFAFAYHLIDGLSDRRQQVGEPYGSMFSSDGERFPPFISDVADEDVDAWRDAFDSIELSVVRARLGDLLWIRRAKPRPDLTARGAVAGLLSLATDTAWRSIERTRLLARALEITRELRDRELQTTVIAAIRDHIEADLASEDGGPGVSLGVLRPLATLPDADHPEDLDELIVRVGERYDQDPYIAAAVFDLRLALTDAEGREHLVRAAIERWRAEATRGDAILRVHRLERALELARANGIQNVADELRAELARIAPEELDLKTISTEIEFPKEDVERFLGLFSEAASWSTAFEILAVQPVPGGSPEEISNLVDEMMEQSPLLSLMPKAVIGPDNATAIFRAATPEAHRKLAIAKQRSQATRVWSIFCARALDRIGDRPDRPDRAAMAAFFGENRLAASDVAERVARSVELFWAGETDESAHLVLPRIEAIIREMARLAGIPIIHEPRPGQEIGGVAMLGGMLHDLRAYFDDTTLPEYLINLLTDQLGMNLRNRILHGLHGPVDKLDAALLIQVAVSLSRMRIAAVEHGGDLPPTVDRA